MAESVDVVVVGGGVAGLAAATRLVAAGRRVALLERGKRLGGVLGSVSVAGHRFETGPNTLQSSGEAWSALVRELGLDDQLVTSAPEAKRRLVWRGGQLHDLPTSPPALLRSKLMNRRGKLRLLAEPMVPRRKDGAPETLAEFTRRRLGAEALAAFVDPFVAGIYAGRADEIGADAFPSLVALERDHGSLLRGMVAKRRQGGASPGSASLVSLRGGLEALPRRAAERLGAAVHLSHEVLGVARAGDLWRVTARAPSGEIAFEGSSVVLATPAAVTAELLRPLDAAAADTLTAVPHPHVAAVGLGFRRREVVHPLDAFGLLVAPDSPLPGGEPVLGVLFPSSIFADRAPRGGVTLAVMMGGSRYPAAREATDAQLVDAARSALRRLLGVRGDPTAVAVTRHARAIPQYRPGHLARMADLQARLAAQGDLRLAGNYVAGVSVNDTIASGFEAARRVLEGRA